MNKLNILLIFCLLSVLSCKNLLGTDVGNPAVNFDQNPDCESSRCAIQPFADEHVSFICQKVLSCFYLDQDLQNAKLACHQQVMPLPELSKFMDLPFDNYIELAIAIKNKHYIKNVQAESMCYESIQNLSCESTEINSVYTSQSPSNFSAFHFLLTTDASCRQLFIPRGNL